MTSVTVSLSRVSLAFGDQPVLSDISLTLEAGTVTALVGESGSGKSTLLQLINGLLQPDQGDVQVFGESPGGSDPVRLRRRIGYAVQHAALFPHLTVAANIGLLARLEGWDEGRIARRLAALFSWMELDEALGRRYPHELSGGQQQRASLCRALMLQPPLLLLDEPFSAVDPITRAGIVAQFAEVARHERFTALLVTHDMREALQLADRLVLLRGGRIEQQGSRDQVLAAPASPWVARLLETQLT